MPQFNREVEVRNLSIPLRVTKDEMDWIDSEVQRLDLPTRAEFLRLILDHWQATQGKRGAK